MKQFVLRRQQACFGLLSMVFLIFGCSGDPVGRIPVTGKVTYGGGPWPAEGVVYFNPSEPAAGFPRLNGIGRFGTDGEFQVQSTGEGMGLVPGTYKVSVECWETPPNMEGKPVKSYVPSQFTAPEVTVETGESSKEIVIDVPKPS